MSTAAPAGMLFHKQKIIIMVIYKEREKILGAVRNMYVCTRVRIIII